VHAIERLRWVAQAEWAPAEEVASEAAWALAELAYDEPMAVLPACRRLLQRHPACGPMWWVAAHVLGSADPEGSAAHCADLLLSDPTEEVLVEALSAVPRAVRRGSLADVAGAEVVVVTAEAVGPPAMVLTSDRRTLVEAALQLEVPIWLVAGVGRVLPPGLWRSLSNRLVSDSTDPVSGGTDPVSGGTDLVQDPVVVVPRGPSRGAAPVLLASLRGVARVVGPQGAAPPGQALAATPCPEPAELVHIGGW
jgi:hypothetical protein